LVGRKKNERERVKRRRARKSNSVNPLLGRYLLIIPLAIAVSQEKAK
jgi:hypothetical protein